jgi:hypothetical protein
MGCLSSNRTLAQNKWLNDMALTDAGKAHIGQRFRDWEAKPRAFVAWQNAKLRLMAPFKRELSAGHSA